MKLFLKYSNLCDHNSPTLQTDRQTTCDGNTALCTKVHRAVINVSNGQVITAVDAIIIMVVLATAAAAAGAFLQIVIRLSVILTVNPN